MSQRIVGPWQSFIVVTKGDDVVLAEDNTIEIREINLRTGALRGTHGASEVTGSISLHGASFNITIDSPEDTLRYEGILSQDTLHLADKNVLMITGRVFAPDEFKREGVVSGLQDKIDRVRADNQEQATWMATKQG